MVSIEWINIMTFVVVELLVRFHNNNNWNQSIQEGIPLRKKNNETAEDNI